MSTHFWLFVRSAINYILLLPLNTTTTTIVLFKGTVLFFKKFYFIDYLIFKKKDYLVEAFFQISLWCYITISIIFGEVLYRMIIMSSLNTVWSILEIFFYKTIILLSSFGKNSVNTSKKILEEDTINLDYDISDKPNKSFVSESVIDFLNSYSFWKTPIRNLNFLVNSGLNLNNNYMKHTSRYFYRSILYKSSSLPKNPVKDFGFPASSQLNSAYLSLITAVRLWFLPLVVTLFMTFFLSFVRLLPVNTTLFQVFGLLMFFYWLLSGFVFFIKKYKFSKFTSAVQRFWRRAYILFWLLESCLLLVFFYLTLNASQESVYSLDQIASFKSHASSFKNFLPKAFPLILLIVIGYLLLLNLKWNFFKKQLLPIVLVSVILLYVLMQESYQMFHVFNFFSNLFWTYSVEDKLWSLEFDVRRTRLVNHYTIILFVLKYWHVVFIYFFWVFTILRSNESNSLNYPLYSANFQNFIILFIMLFISLYPWVKFIAAPVTTEPYFWFFLNPNSIFIMSFISDIKLFTISLFDFDLQSNYSYGQSNFFYFISGDSQNSWLFHKKQFTRNLIIKNLI